MPHARCEHDGMILGSKQHGDQRSRGACPPPDPKPANWRPGAAKPSRKPERRLSGADRVAKWVRELFRRHRA